MQAPLWNEHSALSLGSRAAHTSRWLTVVYLQDTGGRRNLRDPESLSWLLVWGTLEVHYLLPGGSLWTHTLHSHRAADLSATSVLWNWNTVGAAMRASMSCLSCKPAQSLSPGAQLLGTLCILFRLGVSYCLVGFIPLHFGRYHFAPETKPVSLLPLWQLQVLPVQEDQLRRGVLEGALSLALQE